jgi:hypothetical protein
MRRSCMTPPVAIISALSVSSVFESTATTVDIDGVVVIYNDVSNLYGSLEMMC